MADSKISALSAITSLSVADQLAVAHSGASNSIRADHMPGFQLDYVQITAAVTVTATSDGNSNGTAIIDGNAVTYDGSTRIKIEFYCPWLSLSAGGQDTIINLYDGTTDLGRMGLLVTAASGTLATMYAARFLTPSAASHTYHIRGWITGGSSATIEAAAGGASTYMPAWYRITVA